MVGSRAYLADSTLGLRVVDVTTPSAPSLLGEVLTGGSAERVAVAGDLAYVAASFGGLVIVDVSNPFAPAVVGCVWPGANARGVAVAGTRAYVTVEVTDCVVVVDVSNPAAPSVVGPAFRPHLGLSGAEAPRAGPPSRRATAVSLVRYELSDPDVPAQLPPVTPPAPPWHSMWSGASPTCDRRGRRDVRRVGRARPPVEASGRVRRRRQRPGRRALGNHAYLANRNTGSVEVVDVSNPADPVSLDTALEGLDFFALDVTSSGGQVLIYAGGSAALWVIDATNPSNLIPIGQEPLADAARRSTWSAASLTSATAHSGLKIVDVLEPDQSRRPAACSTPRAS